MKPFDLQKALAGEPVVTRDGREVTQVTSFNAKSAFCLAAVVDGAIVNFTWNGKHSLSSESNHDLFMVAKTVKKEGWVNVYTPDVGYTQVARTSHVYETEREARSSIVPLGIYIATVKIEWEEEI